MVEGLNTPEAEYAKDPKIKKQDILTLLEWASKQPHLPQISEYDFILFYHCTNYSLQATKDIINLHYDFKNYAPELFPGPVFDASIATYNYWETAYTIDTGHVTEEKFRIICAGILDPSKFHVDRAMLEFSKVMFMLALKKGTCPGYVFIFDMKGISLSHLSTLSLMQLKKYLFFVQEAIPLKVRGLHMVNGHVFVEKLMVLMKPFLKKELYDVIFVHTDMNKMFRTTNIKPEFIPVELGGTLPTPRTELIAGIRSFLKAYNDEIRETMAKRIDATKRISENKYSYDVEVLNGSFRKLEVD